MQLGGTTSLTGSYKKNIFRGLTRYSFRPLREVESLTSFWKRQFSPNVEAQVQLDRTLETDLTKYSAQLNWRPDYATITPRVSYDSEGNLEATLSTRFGLARVPGTGEILMKNESFVNTGKLSVFVYLDKDGNFEFNDDDEPIDGARIIAPHNSGSAFTNERGAAYISQFKPNLVTDVFLDNGSLPDPYWDFGLWRFFDHAPDR